MPRDCEFNLGEIVKIKTWDKIPEKYYKKFDSIEENSVRGLDSGWCSSMYQDLGCYGVITQIRCGEGFAVHTGRDYSERWIPKPYVYSGDLICKIKETDLKRALEEIFSTSTHTTLVKLGNLSIELHQFLEDKHFNFVR